MIAFLDTEFTNLVKPELLSLGLAALDGREFYVELDLSTGIGQARISASSDFVRDLGILDQWGTVPGATGTDQEMGRRTGDWLLDLAARCGTRIEVAFDYAVDFQLLEQSLRDAKLWDQVQSIVSPVNVTALTGTIDGELAAEACYLALAKRSLRRHHALADALALRAAYAEVQGTALRLARVVHSDGFRRLVTVVASAAKASRGNSFDAEGWLRRWLVSEAWALGRPPLDAIEEPDGVEKLEWLLRALDASVYV